MGTAKTTLLWLLFAVPLRCSLLGYLLRRFLPFGFGWIGKSPVGLAVSGWLLRCCSLPSAVCFLCSFCASNEEDDK